MAYPLLPSWFSSHAKQTRSCHNIIKILPPPYIAPFHLWPNFSCILCPHPRFIHPFVYINPPVFPSISRHISTSTSSYLTLQVLATVAISRRKSHNPVEMMMKQLVIPAMSSLLLLLVHFTTILAQSPAPAPGPPGPTNITAILEKAGRFSTLIRLLKSTQSADRINTQLNSSDQGLTIFAPADSAFANLKSGSLNSYTDQEKAELIQFHTLPSFLSIQQFQTSSNPLSTEAGGTNYGEFPLNVTTSGNAVNITTGFVNATVVSTVYTDNQLAVYEVDKVLLPESFFVPHPPPPPLPAPAPAPSKHKKMAQSSHASASDAVRLNLLLASILVAVLAASWLF